MMNMNEVLPEDLVKVIFSKLPFFNLSVCRIVCKAWNHLVSDYALSSKFHHRKSLLASTHTFVPNAGFEAMPFCNPKIHSMDLGTNIINYVATFKFDGDWGSIWIFCSCNGLFYIAKVTYDVWCDGIWNPMTNEFIQLAGIYRDIYAFGFGFSPKTKQYKLFRVHEENAHDPNRHCTEVEVWRFGVSNELHSWKVIGWLPLPQSFDHRGEYLDGVIYWIAKWMLGVTQEDEEKNHIYILHAFDVETESFNTSYPSDIGPCTKIDFGIQLVPFKGKIGVIIGPCTLMDYNIQLKSFNGKLRLIITMFQPIWKTCVWIMGAKSWSREFVIDIPIHKPSKLFCIDASENGISLLINDNIYVFDKNGKFKIKIKTLFHTNEIEDVRSIESFQFGSLPKILVGDC